MVDILKCQKVMSKGSKVFTGLGLWEVTGELKAVQCWCGPEAGMCWVRTGRSRVEIIPSSRRGVQGRERGVWILVITDRRD